MYCIFKFNTTTKVAKGVYLSVTLPTQLASDEYYAEFPTSTTAERNTLDMILSSVGSIVYTGGALSSTKQLSKSNISCGTTSTVDLHARKIASGSWNSKVPMAYERAVRSVGMMSF